MILSKQTIKRTVSFITKTPCNGRWLLWGVSLALFVSEKWIQKQWRPACRYKFLIIANRKKIIAKFRDYSVDSNSWLPLIIPILNQHIGHNFQNDPATTIQEYLHTKDNLFFDTKQWYGWDIRQKETLFQQESVLCVVCVLLIKSLFLNVSHWTEWGVCINASHQDTSMSKNKPFLSKDITFLFNRSRDMSTVMVGMVGMHTVSPFAGL